MTREGGGMFKTTVHPCTTNVHAGCVRVLSVYPTVHERVPDSIVKGAGSREDSSSWEWRAMAGSWSFINTCGGWRQGVGLRGDAVLGPVNIGRN